MVLDTTALITDIAMEEWILAIIVLWTTQTAIQYNTKETNNNKGKVRKEIKEKLKFRVLAIIIEKHIGRRGISVSEVPAGYYPNQ